MKHCSCNHHVFVDVSSQPLELSVAYCSGEANNNESAVQCCNDTDLCNRGLHVELPIEEDYYTQHPTSLPATQGARV